MVEELAVLAVGIVVLALGANLLFNGHRSEKGQQTKTGPGAVASDAADAARALAAGGANAAEDKADDIVRKGMSNNGLGGYWRWCCWLVLVWILYQILG